MADLQNQRSAFNHLILHRPDFTLKAQGYQWQVHAEVLSRQSRVFERICNAPFKESIERKVELHEDCPWMVARMIRYFYTNSLDPSDTEVVSLRNMMAQHKDLPGHAKFRSEEEQRSPWQIKALWYTMADKYEITDLVQTTKQQLVHKDTAIMQKTISFLGPSRIATDPELCKLMLHATLDNRQSFRGVFTEVDNMFESHPDIMKQAQDVFSSILDERSKRLKASKLLKKIIRISLARRRAELQSVMASFTMSESLKHALSLIDRNLDAMCNKVLRPEGTK